jgi:hypothetical protein
LLSVLLPFIEVFDLSLIILVFILVAVVLVVAVVLNRRSRGNGMPREFQGIPSPPQVRLSIGRWILLPVALIVVIGFVLAQNWWLNVNILRTMYLIKANLDWWQLTFLDNAKRGASYPPSEARCSNLASTSSQPRIRRPSTIGSP